MRVPVRAADSVSRLVRRRSRWQLPLPAPQRKEDPNGEGCAAPQHGQDNAHADSRAVHSLSCCNLQCIGLQPTMHRVVTFRMRLALCSTNVHLIVTCCINVACTSSSAASSSSHIWRFASPSTAGLVCMLLPWTRQRQGTLQPSRNCVVLCPCQRTVIVARMAMPHAKPKQAVRAASEPYRRRAKPWQHATCRMQHATDNIACNMQRTA